MEDMEQVEPDTTMASETGDNDGAADNDTEMVSTTDNTDTAGAANGDTNTDNADQEEVIEEEDDEARSEATFRFTVENFSQIKDSVLSPPCIVRNLPWKIMIMQRQQPNQDRNTKSVGFFLQCNGESESSAWSCHASADLKMINQRDGTSFSRNITHNFYPKENDWGFSCYMTWSDVLDPDKGYIKDDTVIFEVKVNADAPHGVCWDSKKHTGYVGLKNQGATCYMNSLLQVLYFTNLLRKAVYKMPTESDDSQKSVGLALQRVFYELQFSDKPVGTKKLTKSFGWETLDSFMQHDVQEFLRVLLDKLESKMKKTCVEGTIPKLFEGKMISYIRCKNVDYKSTRTESYYDIQLNIKGKKSIDESFADYVQTETLEGENKYDAGSYGLQDAEKGILFESFPPVLHLHLMRFQYDPITDCSVKFNDRCEFPEVLDLSSYLHDKEAAGSAEESKYVLHAVLVHSGDNHGGHYVVFINPKCDGKWCKFDDDVVSRCTKKEAVDHNFGGEGEEMVAARHSTNAYMLVYIQQSKMNDILGSVSVDDIPETCQERLQEEKKIEAIRRKEKNEAHLFMTVRVILEDAFFGHQGNDLYDPEMAPSHEFRIKKSSTLKEFLATVAEDMKWPVERLRPWPLSHRTNQTLRPNLVELEDGERSMVEVAENYNPWTIFLELLQPDNDPTAPLPTFDKDQDVMLFFKYYCPRSSRVHYMGHMYLAITTKLTSVLPKLCSLANIPTDSKLILWEEIKPNMLEKIEDTNQPLEHILEELMDGDIIVFQIDPGADSQFDLPTAREYFRDLFYKVEVNFCDKNIVNDPGFTLELSQRMNYEQLAKKVAAHLDTDPYLLQFFKAMSYSSRDGPSHPLRCNFEGTLKDLLVYFRPKQVKRIYYQRLTIPINELENKRQFKCAWMQDPPNGEEKELVLYPNRNANVNDLFHEARASGQLDLNDDSMLGSLRLVEIISNKIFSITRPEQALDSLQVGTTKSYRLEEIPKEQEDIQDGDILVPVAHFTKEVFSTFGQPFLLLLSQGDTVGSVKQKIQDKLALGDKEWEKYRVAFVIQGKAHYIDDEEKTIITKDFKGFSMHGNQAGAQGKPWIGLEHTNKANKRSRYNYMEKAIKIYN